MAQRTEGTITIDASPADVMAVIEDFDNYPEWAELKKVEVRDRGPDGRARHVYFEVSAGPINARYTLEYTYKPGNSGVSWTFVEGSGLKDLEGEYLLEGDDNSTTVVYRMGVDLPLPPMPGFMKRKLLQEGEKRIIDTALKGLKRRVEVG